MQFVVLEKDEHVLDFFFELALGLGLRINSPRRHLYLHTAVTRLIGRIGARLDRVAQHRGIV